MHALALLPWWACLVTGVVGYLVLHSIAAHPPSGRITPGNLQGALVATWLFGVANALQVVVPILCLGAALVSFMGRRKRRELVKHVTDGGSAAAAIDAMSWQDFEPLVAEAFRLQGFAVAEKGGAGPDGGIDMELTKDGERWLVQCKHWRAKQVPVEVVRELAGVMPFRRAVGGYVVTSGNFTLPAEEFAAGRGIKLINGKWLQSMLAQARASLKAPVESQRRGTAPAAATSPAEPTPVPAPPSAAVRQPGPACPACSRPMVLRTAKRGANAGGTFWGCTGYSLGCRGTRPA
jgi:restriction system protein